MTKKHFNALAKALRAHQGSMLNNTHEQLSRSVADICTEANPRFNREAFLLACGIPAWALAKEPTP